MPTRRRLIALTATTVSAGVAGCVSPPDDDDDTDDEDEDTTREEDEDEEEDEDDDDVEEEEEPEAEFEFVDLTGPEEVTINEPYTVEFTVENTGDVAGVFETEIRHRPAWGTWTFEDVTLEVEPGETATYTSREFEIPYLRWREFELPDYDERVRTHGIRPRLEPGATIRTPRGIEITAIEAEISRSYTFSRNGSSGRQTTSDTNTRWAKIRIRCTNQAERRRELPSIDEFDALPILDGPVDDERIVDGYHPPDRAVGEGGSREGVLVFEVEHDARGETTRRSDLSLIWERAFDEGDSAARWDFV